MRKYIEIESNKDEAVRTIFKNLLRDEKISAVFGLGESGEGYSYMLFTDAEKLELFEPFAPIMPRNAGQLLSRMTLETPLDKKMVAVLKPCEIRAFAELVKRLQGDRKNIIIFSQVCAGTAKFDGYKNGDFDKVMENSERSDPVVGFAEMREACSMCELFVPMNADFTLFSDNSGSKLFIDSEEALSLCDGQSIKEGDIDKEIIARISNARKSKKEEIFKDYAPGKLGVSGLINIFGRCMNCRGCRSVCPICYCDLCTFESRDIELTPEGFASELSVRGGSRVPPNTLLFHIGRMAHMAVSCVACGMCSDVCPVDIPVATLFKKTGEDIQKVFGYVPGASFAEKVPLVTFEFNELTEVES